MSALPAPASNPPSSSSVDPELVLADVQLGQAALEGSPAHLQGSRGAGSVSSGAPQRGSVCATVDGDDLLVTHSASGGSYLLETHLWVGLDLSVLPATQSGNPMLGLFPHHSGDLEGETSYRPGQYGNANELNDVSHDSFVGDLFGEIFVIAHAVVCS